MAEKKSNEKKSVKKDASAQKGNKVSINYVGSFEDGKVFDASEKHGKPIEFTVGSGQVIAGFDNAVVGMGVGESKDIKIEPKDGYGEPNPELVKIITRDKLPKEREPEVGMVLVLGMGNGMEIPARITKISGDMVTIDLNHPLAGKTLNFRITVVAVE